MPTIAPPPPGAGLNSFGDQCISSPVRRSRVTARVITAGTRISFLIGASLPMASPLGRILSPRWAGRRGGSAVLALHADLLARLGLAGLSARVLHAEGGLPDAVRVLVHHHRVGGGQGRRAVAEVEHVFQIGRAACRE